ncbi:MAG: DUF1778 domain-containing protein [Verrucomicrobiia bacterium]
MPITKGKPKSQRFVARVSGEDKQLFQRAAILEGRSMATFVIVHAREAAERLLSERQVIRLNEADSRRFVETLLAPPRPPTAALKRAMARYRRDVTPR